MDLCSGSLTSSTTTHTPMPIIPLIDDDVITWIVRIDNLTKSVDIGADQLQILLYVSTPTSADGFRIRFETRRPQKAGRFYSGWVVGESRGRGESTRRK